MKKQKTKIRTLTKNEEKKITEALHFIEGFSKMIHDKDEPTKLISIRVPENLLNLLKKKAQYEGKKYQSMIVQAVREYLKKAAL